MANKEKRILISEGNPNCPALRFSCYPFDTEEFMFCAKSGRYVRITPKDCAKCKNPVIAGISRAEAVERMTLALYKKEQKYCSPKECEEYGVVGETCEGCQLWEKYEHLAEAALDAVLGGKK